MKSDSTIHLVACAAEYRGVEDIAVPPLGCLYVGGALRQAGYRVQLHHIVSTEAEATVARILAADPAWVGFSLLTGTPVATAARISRQLKVENRSIPIVWGGVHPSLAANHCLQQSFVDFVVRGEGEQTARDLAAALAAGATDFSSVDGLSWKTAAGGIRDNRDRAFARDIDEFIQDWSLVDPRRYTRSALDGSRYISFITSRGCPHNCAFCYNLVFNKRRWRAHSSEYVIDTVKRIQAVTGVDRLVFNDDNFMVNEERAFEILENLQKIGVRATWLEVRLDRFTDELLERLKSLGVTNLFVGWESGVDTTLDRIAKGFNRELILSAIRIAARQGMELDASAIVGFPFETEADWRATVQTALEMDRLHPGHIKFNIGVYVPYPGTPLAEEALKAGFRFPERAEDWALFDILKGSMRLPWVRPDQIQMLNRADRYARMLYLGGGGGWLSRRVRGLFARIARWRLENFRFAIPVESYLYDWVVTLYVAAKARSVNRNTVGS